MKAGIASGAAARLRAFAAAAWAIMSLGAAWSQPLNYGLRLTPPEPRVGETFTLAIAIPWNNPAQVSLEEPRVTGPADYQGYSVKPSAEGTSIELRFKAVGAGYVELGGLGVVVAGRRTALGDLGLHLLAEASAAPPVGQGRYRLPETAYAFMPNPISVLDELGQTVDAQPRSVPGALLLDGGRGFWLVGDAPGTISLPGLELEREQGRLAVAARTLTLAPPPGRAEGTRALGAWRVGIQALGRERGASPGERVFIEVWSSGSGSVLHALAPEPRVAGPDGVAVELARSGGVERSWSMAEGADAELGLSGRVTAIYSFIPRVDGPYTISLEPYYWFDMRSGRVVAAEARPISMLVSPAEGRSWAPPPEVGARLEALASDRAVPAELRRAAALMGEGKGLAGLAEALGASRGFWPHPVSRELIALGSAAFGLPPPKAERWPPPGYPSAAAAAALATALAAALAGRRRSDHDRGGGIRRAAAVLAAALSIASLALAAVSWYERAAPRGVVAADALRSAPDERAATPFSVAPGSVFTVTRRGGAWLLASFDDDRSAWIRADHVVFGGTGR